MKNLTLVTVNWNQQKCVELLLKSYVEHHGEGPHDLILIDNGSTDFSKEWLALNEIPFVDLPTNIGHENAFNLVFDKIQTDCALFLDTDVEFTDGVYRYRNAVLEYDYIAAGEYIDKNYINDIKIKNRLSPWFMAVDMRKVREAGIGYFRDPNCEDWTYDVGSWLTEKLEALGELFHIIRLNDNQDGDLVSMEYEKFRHWGKVSWDVFEKHQDRIDEVQRRRNAIEEEVEKYDHINLIGKFKSGL